MMPASSSSFVISTSIYLLSSTLFLGIAYSPVQGSLRGADMKMVGNIADGLQWQLDSLSPGVVIPLSWEQTIMHIPVSVSFARQSVTVTFRDVVTTRETHWMLPSMVLDPAKTYLASLHGDEITIETNGFS